MTTSTATKASTGTRTWTVPRRTASVPAARHTAERLLQAWDCGPDTVDAAALIVSELVTNAVQHADGPDITCKVSLHRDAGDTLTLSVTNTDSHTSRDHIPHPRQPEDLQEGGRGLNIVTMLAADWGTRLVSGQREVWASMPACP